MLQLQYLVLNKIFKTPNEYFLLKRFSWMVFIVLFFMFQNIEKYAKFSKVKVSKNYKMECPLNVRIKEKVLRTFRNTVTSNNLIGTLAKCS